MRNAEPTHGVYVDDEGLIALEQRGRRLTFLPRQAAHSLLSGRHASRMRGRGLDFDEIRDYRVGDDVRSIDWKVTVRLQAPHVRVFDEERDRAALLVVDQRLSMFFGSRRAMKSVTAAEAAALAAWRVLNAGDRVGAVVFNDADVVAIKPRHSRRMVLEILRTIAAKNRALGVGRHIVSAPDMLNRALDQTRRLALHDATVIVISDFDGADIATRRAMATIGQKNDVVAVLVHDPLQSELPASGRMTVTNGELQVAVDTGKTDVRRNIVEMSRERLRDVFTWTRELQIPVLPLSTAEDPTDQLHRLLGLLPKPGGPRERRGTAGMVDG